MKYRTFDQVLEDIHVDFQNYNLQNMIEPQQLIKVVKRCNYDLGLRIFKTKEEVLHVEKGRVKLPDDFYILNFAMICDEVTYVNPISQGTWIEERPLITPYKETVANIDLCAAPTVNCQRCAPQPCGCQAEDPSAGLVYDPLAPTGNYCNKPRVYLNCKNEAYELVQIVKGETRTYKRLIPLTIINNGQTIDCDCPNLYVNGPDKAWIKDGYLFMSTAEAKVYINYQGAMEDDDGNLLLPDHDMINEYYEYAIKKRILENLIMNDEAVSQAKIQLINDGYSKARRYALSIVRTPNFSELKQVFEMNRKAQYSKYYDMFKSYPWNQYNPWSLTNVTNRV